MAVKGQKSVPRGALRLPFWEHPSIQYASSHDQKNPTKAGVVICFSPPHPADHAMAEVESVKSSKFGATDSDSVSSITFFPPFAEEDADDQSSYALVSALFSRVRNAVSSSVNPATGPNPTLAGYGNPPALDSNLPQQQQQQSQQPQTRRPSLPITNQTQTSYSSTNSQTPGGRPNTLASSAKAAPPLVSLTPAQSEVPTYSQTDDRSPSRAGSFYSNSPLNEGEGLFGTTIPGFPIQDDARSIKTSVSTSLQRSSSVSKVIRRIRGEGKHYPTNCSAICSTAL